MPRRFLSGYFALCAVSGCSGLIGLDPKREAPDGASAEAGGVADDAGAGDAAGGDATIGVPADSSIGLDATALDDTGSGDPDAGCSAQGPVPDGAPRTFYGSCVPHLTANQGICNAYGYTGDLGATPTTLQIQKNVCTMLKGTWANGPCDLDGAVFGCESASSAGYVCESLVISWFYPPHTTNEEDSGCPASVGTVELP